MLWPIIIISASLFAITKLLRSLLKVKVFSYEATEADIAPSKVFV